MKHIYTSVDIGSDSIKIVVCELFKNKLNLPNLKLNLRPDLFNKKYRQALKTRRY